MNVRHYFAYGSNMNPARVEERGLLTVQACAAYVRGLRLAFDKVSGAHPDCAHANVVHDRQSVVQGVLYELGTDAEIFKMDVFERAPINYGRDVVQAETRDGTIHAWTYFANRHARREGLLPPASYMAHLLEGAPYLPDDYLQWLRQHPTAPR